MEHSHIKARPELSYELPPIPNDLDLTVRNQKRYPDVATLLVNAQTLIQHQEFQAARVLCLKALTNYPNHPEAIKKMILVKQKSNDSEGLLAFYQTLSQIEPTFAHLVDFATALYQAGQDEKSLDTYFEAMELQPQTSDKLFEAYKNIGNIFVKSADYDAAEEFYNKAHTINPRSDILAVNLGTLEIQRGEFGSALQRFRDALSYQPNNDKAWVGLALAHNHMGDHNLAIANLENAIDCNPRNKTAVHLLANWSVRDQKFEPAIAALQKYLSLTEFDEEMSLLLIHLFCLAGRLDMALLEIERLLLWNPGNEEVAELEQRIKAQEGIVACQG